jgi:DNA-binding MarR family transcriptional regulator
MTSKRGLPREPSLSREEFDEVLFQALRGIYIFERDKVDRFKLSYQEIFLLQYLRRHSPASMTAISLEMRLPLSTCSRLVGRLEKMRLLCRKKAERDRRIILVSLNKKGEKAVTDVEQHSFETILANLANYSAGQIESFIATARELGILLRPRVLREP